MLAIDERGDHRVSGAAVLDRCQAKACPILFGQVTGQCAALIHCFTYQLGQQISPGEDC